MSGKTAKPKRQAPAKKAKARTRRNNKQRQQQTISVPYLSDCAKDYLHTLANPCEGPIGCVPSNIPLRTLKQRVFVRGTLSTGTAASGNFGFILLDPYNGTASDGHAVAFSDATYTGLSINVSGANVSYGFTNSMFVQSDIGQTNQDAEVRIVGAELKVRYAGTALNMGGTITGLHEPDHNTMNGLDSSSIAQHPMSKRAIVDNKWYRALYVPADPNDFTLISPVFLDPTAAPINANANRYYMGFIINSAIPQQPFAFEATICYEIVGAKVQGATRTPADPNAVAIAVTAAAQNRPGSQTPAQTEETMLQRAYDHLRTGITTTMQLVGMGARLAQAAQQMSLANIPTRLSIQAQ